MSQHIFPAKIENRSVSVMLGWDRPLRGYFMVIDSDDQDEPIYSNLGDEALVASGGLHCDLDYFVDKAMEFGVAVPDAVVEAVYLDGVFNTGNLFVRYDECGVRLTEPAPAN